VVEIRQLGGIRNFGWLQPGLLARGEMPPLDDGTAEILAAEGIRSVISLRQEGEPEGTLTGRLVPAYVAAQQGAACERVGLRFLHLGCTDYQSPRPDEVAASVRAIDAEVDSGRPVLVHCRAGVGRTSIVTCTWLMTRGMSGDDAARIHLQFLDDLDDRLKIPPAMRAAYLKRVNRAQQWWGFRQIAASLGTPVTDNLTFPPPERPEIAGGWEHEYREALRPWREALGR
jgi:protein tyrosine phosphatase (PTP) superfamily phosphohydrolase (DUF442 family)